MWKKNLFTTNIKPFKINLSSKLNTTHYRREENTNKKNPQKTA